MMGEISTGRRESQRMVENVKEFRVEKNGWAFWSDSDGTHIKSFLKTQTSMMSMIVLLPTDLTEIQRTTQITTVQWLMLKANELYSIL